MLKNKSKLTALICAVFMTSSAAGCASLGVRDTDNLDNGKDEAPLIVIEEPEDSEPTPDEVKPEPVPVE